MKGGFTDICWKDTLIYNRITNGDWYCRLSRDWQTQTEVAHRSLHRRLLEMLEERRDT